MVQGLLLCYEAGISNLQIKIFDRILHFYAIIKNAKIKTQRALRAPEPVGSPAALLLQGK